MKIKILLIFALTSTLLNAQTAKTLVFGGLTRDYLEYVPSVYNGASPVPVVICLHGLGDNMTNFFGIGMNYVADTANFIVITPQARMDALAGGNAWNSGASYLGYQLSQSVNDVGFLNALLDTVIAHYNVDLTRIYACGFSLGGFMCQRLACESANRFAAIASVSGTRGSAITTCTPAKPMPVCHFHGTTDGTISYTANLYGNNPETLVSWWVNYNTCNPVPVTSAIPDIASDGKTIDHFLYADGGNGTDVEFYKVNNGAHEWLFLPNNDISYTLEIWKFFMKYPKGPAGVDMVNSENNITVFPNPVSDFITIGNLNKVAVQSIEILNYSGQILYSNLNYKGEPINTLEWSNGVYLLRYYNSVQNSTRKFVISR